MEPVPESSTSPPLIVARALEKWYGPQPAVRGVDFSLKAGEFLTLFGPNGAGKTTLLRLLTGAVRPTRGEIQFSQADANDEHDWQRRVGVLSHQTFLYGQLTAEENLNFYGRLYSLTSLSEKVRDLLDKVGLWERRRERVRTFSRGMQQRLALARTLLHDPEMVLLDEPYTGLDPHASKMLRGIMEHLRDGRRTIFLVTHNFSEGLELADRVVIQVSGRWVLDERRDALNATTFEKLYTERVEEIR
jgi:heme exporter protein A